MIELTKFSLRLISLTTSRCETERSNVDRRSLDLELITLSDEHPAGWTRSTAIEVRSSPAEIDMTYRIQRIHRIAPKMSIIARLTFGSWSWWQLHRIRRYLCWGHPSCPFSAGIRSTAHAVIETSIVSRFTLQATKELFIAERHFESMFGVSRTKDCAGAGEPTKRSESKQKDRARPRRAGLIANVPVRLGIEEMQPFTVHSE